MSIFQKVFYVEILGRSLDKQAQIVKQVCKQDLSRVRYLPF